MLAEQGKGQERRLQKVTISLMRNPKFAFWASILMVGKVRVIDEPITARTNGRDEDYGRDFIDMLSDKELAFLRMHECAHKVFRHLTTWRALWKENAKLANMACDYVINLKLLDLDPQCQFIAMPTKDGKPLGMIDAKYRGMNAKQIYDLLKQEQKDKDQQGQPDGASGSDGAGDSGAGLDEHDWEGSQELSKEEAQKLEREIDQAVRAGVAAAKAVGKGGGGIDRDIGELLTPRVNWRDQMRDIVKSVCSRRDSSSWRRINRRMLGSMGILMPSVVSEQVKHIVVARDTSGSMRDNDLLRCASETMAIVAEVNPQVLDVIDWDGVVEKHEQVLHNNVSNTITTAMRGGGGTDPLCVARYLKDKAIKPEMVVILTDGEISSWGNDEDWQGVPVVWAVVNNKRVTAPMGKTIHVEH